MTLSISVSPSANGNQTVALGGRLDAQNYAELDEQLAPLLASSIHSLVLDLQELAYISSAGLRSIFKARKALSGRGGKVVVVNPQPQIQKVFDVVKAVPMNEVFRSIAEADAYLDTLQKKVVFGQDED